MMPLHQQLTHSQTETILLLRLKLKDLFAPLTWIRRVAERCRFPIGERRSYNFESASSPDCTFAVVGVEFQACGIWERWFGLPCSLQDRLMVRIPKKIIVLAWEDFYIVHPMGSINLQGHHGAPPQLRDPFRKHGFQVPNGIIFLNTHKKVDYTDIVSPPSVFWGQCFIESLC